MGAFIDGDIIYKYPTGSALGDDSATLRSPVRSAKIDTSFIAALKGKAAPAPIASLSPAPAAGEASPDAGLTIPELPPIVAPRQIDEDDLYPVSATIPVSEVHQELGRLRAEYEALENALQLANETITHIHGQLGDANAQIGTLLAERTQGVESIIQSLRDYQIGGLKAAPGVVNSSLSDIFKNTTALKDYAAITGSYEELETRLGMALKVFQSASGNSFHFALESYERRDFWHKDNYELTLNNQKPAKMILLHMAKQGTDLKAAEDRDQYLIVAVQGRIYSLPFSDIKTKLNKVDMFMNAKGTVSQGIMFTRSSDRLYYNYPNGGDYGEQFTNVSDSIDKFIGEFLTQNLLGLISSADFNKAVINLKIMGLTP